jgi:hypothetical protein
MLFYLLLCARRLRSSDARPLSSTALPPSDALPVARILSHLRRCPAAVACIHAELTALLTAFYPHLLLPAAAHHARRVAVERRTATLVRVAVPPAPDVPMDTGDAAVSLDDLGPDGPVATLLEEWQALSSRALESRANLLLDRVLPKVCLLMNAFDRPCVHVFEPPVLTCLVHLFFHLPLDCSRQLAAREASTVVRRRVLALWHALAAAAYPGLHARTVSVLAGPGVVLTHADIAADPLCVLRVPRAVLAVAELVEMLLHVLEVHPLSLPFPFFSSFPCPCCPYPHLPIH